MEHNIAKSSEFSVGEMKPFKVGDENILVYRLDDGFYATQNRCTHLFASLSKGKLVDGCKVECPLHKARFDVRTGEVQDWANFPPGIQLLNKLRAEKALKTYPVEVKDDSVFVSI